MSIDLIISLFGGLGLFLFGMRLMGDGLEHAAGPKLKHFLSAMTSNRFIAMLTGLCVTAIIQSSGATTVMVVGFVNAQLLTLSQSIGVTIGANIGTTVTSLLLSIPFDPGALFALLGMTLTLCFGRRETVRQTGYVFTGLGILFIGMTMMSNAMEPLRENTLFISVMQTVTNPFLGVMVGMLITALLQSSSVSVGILQTLSISGLITTEGAFYMLLGANVGSCVPCLLAMAGTRADAKRAAVSNLLFSLVKVVLFLTLSAFLPLTRWAETLVPGNPKLCISFMHISINVVTAIVVMPVADLIIRLATVLVPEGKATADNELKLHFYDERLLKTPAIAAEQLYKEICRMGENAIEHFQLALHVLCTLDFAEEKNIEAREELSDFLEDAITEGLVSVMSLDISEHESRKIGHLFHIVNDLERISDHAMNLMSLSKERQERNARFSDKAMEELEDLGGHVVHLLKNALRGLEDWQVSTAEMGAVEAEEELVDELTEALRNRHINRLKEKKCAPKSGVVFLESINNLERVADHATNVAACAQEASKLHVHPAEESLA